MVGTQATRQMYRTLLSDLGFPFGRRTPKERVCYLVHFSYDLVEAGGLDALFFCDWHGAADYRALIGAYRVIGATKAAAILTQVAALFPGGCPPANVLQRRRLLERIGVERGERTAIEQLEQRLLSQRAALSRCLARMM